MQNKKRKRISLVTSIKSRKIICTKEPVCQLLRFALPNKFYVDVKRQPFSCEFLIILALILKCVGATHLDYMVPFYLYRFVELLKFDKFSGVLAFLSCDVFFPLFVWVIELSFYSFFCVGTANIFLYVSFLKR